MEVATIPYNEDERLNELYSYRILDSAGDSAFDEVVELAAEACDMPIALITLIDESRQWFKARVGLEVKETERSIAFCSHAILQDDVMVVRDTHNDRRFNDNPLVTGEPNIRFYAGAPLITEQGNSLGTVCVIDRKPRQLTPSQLKTLCLLRGHVITLLKIRKQNLTLKALNAELDAFSAAASHDLISPTRRIANFGQILLDDYAQNLDQDAVEIITRIKNSAVNMQDLVVGLLGMSRIARSPLNYRRVNMSEIANSILQELSESSGRKVEFSIEEDMISHADSSLMRIVLENLFNNAWKFSAYNDLTEIRFYKEKKNGENWFTVQDNGVGFDMQFAGKLFKPFERLHRQEEFKGSGIGLATVQRIIHRLGGEITISSKLNEGTAVSFSLD